MKCSKSKKLLLRRSFETILLGIISYRTLLYTFNTKRFSDATMNRSDADGAGDVVIAVAGNNENRIVADGGAVINAGGTDAAGKSAGAFENVLDTSSAGVAAIPPMTNSFSIPSMPRGDRTYKGALKNPLIVIVIGSQSTSRESRWQMIRETWAKEHCNVFIFAGSPDDRYGARLPMISDAGSSRQSSGAGSRSRAAEDRSKQAEYTFLVIADVYKGENGCSSDSKWVDKYRAGRVQTREGCQTKCAVHRCAFIQFHQDGYCGLFHTCELTRNASEYNSPAIVIKATELQGATLAPKQKSSDAMLPSTTHRLVTVNGRQIRVSGQRLQDGRSRSPVSRRLQEANPCKDCYNYKQSGECSLHQGLCMDPSRTFACRNGGSTGATDVASCQAAFTMLLGRESCDDAYKIDQSVDGHKDVWACYEFCKLNNQCTHFTLFEGMACRIFRGCPPHGRVRTASQPSKTYVLSEATCQPDDPVRRRSGKTCNQMRTNGKSSCEIAASSRRRELGGEAADTCQTTCKWFLACQADNANSAASSNPVSGDVVQTTTPRLPPRQGETPASELPSTTLGILETLPHRDSGVAKDVDDSTTQQQILNGTDESLDTANNDRGEQSTNSRWVRLMAFPRGSACPAKQQVQTKGECWDGAGQLGYRTIGLCWNMSRRGNCIYDFSRERPCTDMPSSKLTPLCRIRSVGNEPGDSRLALGRSQEELREARSRNVGRGDPRLRGGTVPGAVRRSGGLPEMQTYDAVNDAIVYPREQSILQVVKLAMVWVLKNTDSKWILLVRDDSMVHIDDVEDMLRDKDPVNSVIGCDGSDGTPSDDCGILITRDIASTIAETCQKGQATDSKMWPSSCIRSKPRFFWSNELSNSKLGACDRKSNKLVVGSGLAPDELQSCWRTSQRFPVMLQGMFSWKIRCMDILMQKSRWESPIVVEKYKLIFFSIPKVACTQFKQLFRRMMGLTDWRVGNDEIPHNPAINGLHYIHHFPSHRVMEMMSDPSWTKAVFFRDPYERLASAYLDKSRSDYLETWCSFRANKKPGQDDFKRFVDKKCDDPHWRPQFQLIEPAYWSFINFVGEFATLYADTRRLLENIGAWEEFGKQGYGTNGNLAIFQENAMKNRSTDAHEKTRQLYEKCRCTEKVRELYKDDLYLLRRLLPPAWEPMY